MRGACLSIKHLKKQQARPGELQNCDLDLKKNLYFQFNILSNSFTLVFNQEFLTVQLGGSSVVS